jgi:hypothetical protein
MEHHKRHEDVKLDLLCRIYAVELEGRPAEYWASPIKSPDDFQEDMREFASQFKNIDPDTLVFHLKEYLTAAGYVRVADLVTERFVGRIVSTRSRILQDE